MAMKLPATSKERSKVRDGKKLALDKDREGAVGFGAFQPVQTLLTGTARTANGDKWVMLLMKQQENWNAGICSVF